MNHIVNTYPLTQFEGGLNLLHEAVDDDAVIWLKSTATAAVAKEIILDSNGTRLLRKVSFG